MNHDTLAGRVKPVSATTHTREYYDNDLAIYIEFDKNNTKKVKVDETW